MSEVDVFGWDSAQSLHSLLSLDFGFKLVEELSEDVNEFFRGKDITESGNQSNSVQSNSVLDLKNTG